MIDDAPARWTPGTHHGIVWPGGAALLDGSVSVEVANELWELLATVVELGDFLTALAETTGTGLVELPGFAVVVVDAQGTAQLAARGDLAATARVDAATVVIDGTGVKTWSERAMPGATGVALTSSEYGDTTAHRPIVAGVVPASALLVGRTDAPAAAPEPVDDVDAVDAVDVRAVDIPPPTVEVEVVLEVEPSADLEVPPEAEDLGEFGEVWMDHTIAGDVEAAAVRPSDGEIVVPAAPKNDDVVPSAPKEITWFGTEDEEAAAAPPPLPPVAKAPTIFPFEPSAEAPSSGFISAVPSVPASVPSVPASVPPAPPPAPPAPAPAPAPPGPSFWSGTAPPILPPAPPAPPAPHALRPTAPPAPGFGDHDGETIAQMAVGDIAPVGPAAPVDPSAILAAVCDSGHANPPQRPQCRTCGLALTNLPVRVSHPSLGWVVPTRGEALELTGPVIIGRAPRAARFQGAEMPRLMVLPDAHISATHLALRIDGWTVLAHDLGSTNGTFLRRNNQPPFRLLDQPQILVPGDVVDLGHGVQLRFEELP